MVVKWWFERKDKRFYFEIREGNLQAYYFVELNDLGWK